MKVFTTHADIDGLAETPELLSLWEASWRAHGWEPVVLAPSRDLQLWHDLHDLCEGRDSVNPKPYRDQCITRWVDFWQAGGGLMADMDLINSGLEAESFVLPGEDESIIYTATRDFCPCGVFASRSAALAFIDTMFSLLDMPDVLKSLSPSLDSDQEMFRYAVAHELAQVEALDYAQHYGSPGWENHELVHFGTYPCLVLGGGRSKEEIIREFLNGRTGNEVKENDKP